MRLVFSIAVLLVLVCVVIEISEAKSNRNAESTKGNLRSGNSKGVRYSKNKSDFKKRGDSKKQDEITLGKKPRRSVEGNGNNEADGSVKKNGKVSHEEQKRQKFNKQNKNTGSFKNDKQSQVTKGSTSKRQKRSVDREFEQTTESLTKFSTDRSLNNGKSQLNSASKKKAESKFQRLTEADTIVDIEGVPNDQHSKETASLLDKKVENSKKSETVAEERHAKPKKIKQQDKNHKSEESRKKNVDLKKSESIEEQIQTSEETVMSENTNKSLNDPTEEQTTGKNSKTDKSSKKSSKAVSKNESQGNKDSSLSNSDNQKQEVNERSKKYKSGSCKLGTQGLKDKDEIDTEKSKNTVDSSIESSVVNTEQQETENKVLKSVDPKLSEEDEAQKSPSGVEAENCIQVATAEVHVMEESCSTE